MGIPLSRVLLDFGAANPVSPAARPGSPVSVVPPRDPVDDLARRIDEAYARGHDEARLSADAEHERKLAEALAAAEAEHAAERARWASEQADELAARLGAAVQLLEERIADTVGRVLTPFVAAEMRSKSMEALAESIRTVLSGANPPALRISGPEDLLSTLRDRLPAGAVAIEWEPNGEADVTVSAGDAVIETEIAGWLDRFAEARR
jgi:hypothetical protein